MSDPVCSLAPAHVRDDCGFLVAAEPPAWRIVSLVPSLTEWLFAVGAGERVVGVTRYCEEPRRGVAHVRKIGGTKNPDLDAIVALAPDLVVANAEENRREHIAQLRAAGLRVFVSYPRRVEDLPSLFRTLGRLLALTGPAQRLVEKLERVLGETPARAQWRVFVPIWQNPWMSLNGDTYAHDLLRCCGGQNVCANYVERYPRVQLEEIAASDPEIVLLPDEPYRFDRQHLQNFQALFGTTAWRSRAVYFVDGKALTWFGPRTAGAIAYLRTFFPAR